VRRARRLALASVAGAVAAAAVAVGVSAHRAGGPFYLVPSPTKECQNIKNCIGATGPWVIVPAGREVTYLYGCPKRIGFIAGGTDARASSRNIRVWFDGKLGGPIGVPANPKGASILLFHAVSNDGKLGSFQPVLGCVSLTAKNKRSTVSAVPGTPPGAPLDLRANTVLITQERASALTAGCPRNEKLVGSWGAYALNTSGPPDAALANAVKVRTFIAGGKVHAVYTAQGIVLVPLAPRAWVQVGAMCEP
jgi:hypothetical protein